MKNFEHYQEQIKGFDHIADCELYGLRAKVEVKDKGECEPDCGDCLIKSLRWLSEEYKEPKTDKGLYRIGD